MTRAEFMDWLRSQQKPAHKPKSAPALREPGDESEMASVGNLGDRLQKSLNERRMQSYGENTRETARTR